MQVLRLAQKGLLAILIINNSIIVNAQQDDIEEITVTADPLGNVDDHVIQPTQVLSSEDLKRQSIQTIGETVSGELGVTSSDFGAGVGRPVIRGMGGGRVRVMENGISTMDASTVSSDHAVTSEPVFAEQIEILRGPATLLYGSGASGGLVNVVSDRIPREIPDDIESKMVIQYETVNDGFTGAGGINAGGGNLAIHISGMKRDTSDYDIPGFAESLPDEGEEPGTLENSGTNTENVTGGLAFINDTINFGFSVSGLNSLYGIPGHGHGHGEEEEEDGGVKIDMEQIRYDLSATLHNPLSGIKEIRSRWGYNDYQHNEIEPSGEIGTSFSNEELEGRIELIHNPMSNGIWNGVVGIQINSRDFSAIGEEAFLPPAEQDAFSIFLVEKADFNQWHFDLGFRFEHQNNDSSTGESTNHDVYSFGGGVSYDYDENYELGLSIGRSQRAPTIEEIFSNGPHLATNAFEIGDVGLTDETSTNIDFHWHKTKGPYTFKVNLFYNFIDDFIYLQEQDLNNDGVPDRVEEDFSGDISEILDPDEDEEPLLLFHTQNNAEFKGFEIEGIINLFNSDHGILNVRIWSDYVDAKLIGNGETLPRISPLRIGTGVDYIIGPWDFDLSLTHTADKDDIATLEGTTQGYEMLNIYIGYNFDLGNTSFTFFGKGNNLLNQEARRHTSVIKDIAPLPGRSGIIGIRASF